MISRITCSVVVPVYNEELVIDETYKRLKEVMDGAKETYQIIFVNDGSMDSSRNKIEDLCKKDDKITLVNFSRNFGHQAAISAGMDASNGKCVVVIDADLQDPPEVIIKMLEKWKAGYEVVHGKRTKRQGESAFKKLTAAAYYRLLRKITSVDIPVDTGDFRLIDRKVCNALTSLPEKNRYVRGLVSWVGYKQTFVEFSRQGRFAGETKYPLKKMIKLALDGLTSFSHAPLVISGYLGAVTSLIGFIMLIISVINNVLNGSFNLSLGLFLSINMIMFGLVFCCMGIMGEYIGRISDESKGRPLYIIESKINYKRVDRYAVGS
ncbi:MAG: glycosyltransferase family 2 protein [Solirubrobacterales bacterium]